MWAASVRHHPKTSNNICPRHLWSHPPVNLAGEKALSAPQALTVRHLARCLERHLAFGGVRFQARCQGGQQLVPRSCNQDPPTVRPAEASVNALLHGFSLKKGTILSNQAIFAYRIPNNLNSKVKAQNVCQGFSGMGQDLRMHFEYLRISTPKAWPTRAKSQP